MSDTTDSMRTDFAGHGETQVGNAMHLLHGWGYFWKGEHPLDPGNIAMAEWHLTSDEILRIRPGGRWILIPKIACDYRTT